MRNATTVRIMNIGAEAHRRSWTAVARRSRFERALMLLVTILVGIPLLLLLIGIGVIALAIGTVAAICMAGVFWVRRRFGSGMPRPTEAPGRENVRVIRRPQQPRN